MSDVAAERARQAGWRAWAGMLDAVERWQGRGLAGLKALDLGCGTGEVSALLAERGYEVTGVDGDGEMIAAARACHDRSGHTIGLVHTDLVTGLAGIPGPADLVWISFTVQYFSGRYEEVLTGWAGLLRPGGLLAIVETDGLFACHEPQADGGATAFEGFERWWADTAGYDTRCGRSVAAAVAGTGLFDVLEDSNWADAELAFDGPAPPEIAAAWTSRLGRAGVSASLEKYFGADAAPRRAQAFLDCLAAPDHTTSSRLRLVIARRTDRAGPTGAASSC